MSHTVINTAIKPEVMNLHQRCTAIRAQGYNQIFGVKPIAVYAFHQLRGNDDGLFLIDVFAYPLQVGGVTNPLSRW
jgi:hypothetical protein